MATSLVAGLLISLVTVVSADLCSYQLYPDRTDRTAYCSYGCCYTMIYPCCSEPFYLSAGFIAPMVVGSVGMIIGFIVIVIVVMRRRKRQGTPTVLYTAPMLGQQVVTPGGGVITYSGYGNTHYIAQPMYQSQPANGTMPMYPMQPGSRGAAPMYMMPPPSGAPPAYVLHQAEGPAPPYTTQPNEGAEPMQTKTPLQ
ncbi:hypothetical protein BsWGS_22604 [Bradybaena similaris]